MAKSAKKRNNSATKIYSKWTATRREARRSISDLRSVIKDERTVAVAGIKLTSEVTKVIQAVGDEFKATGDIIKQIRKLRFGVEVFKTHLDDLNTIDKQLSNTPIPKGLIGEKLDELSLHLLELLAEVQSTSAVINETFIEHSDTCTLLLEVLSNQYQLDEATIANINKTIEVASDVCGKLKQGE